MALPDPNGASAGDTPDAAAAFLEQSYLTYIIPFATKFDPEEALQRDGASIESNIAGTEQRDQLFFGTRFASGPRPRGSHCSCAHCR
jgi:hypothetical protein